MNTNNVKIINIDSDNQTYNITIYPRAPKDNGNDRVWKFSVSGDANQYNSIQLEFGDSVNTATLCYTLNQSDGEWKFQDPAMVITDPGNFLTPSRIDDTKVQVSIDISGVNSGKTLEKLENAKYQFLGSYKKKGVWQNTESKDPSIRLRRTGSGSLEHSKKGEMA